MKRRGKRSRTRKRTRKHIKTSRKNIGGMLDASGYAEELPQENLQTSSDIFAKKIAAKKISRFMTQPQIQEKRRGEFLKIICSDSNVCIAFGTEDKKIRTFFNEFIDFQYVVPPIKKIGKVSANGFVNEIMYNRNGYIAYSVLKSSLTPKSDNLMYEYIVGKYLNKMSIYYPCFLKTYGIYEYVNVSDYNNMSSNTTIQDTSLLNRLARIETSEPPTVSELEKACNRSQYMCILVQHIKNAIPLRLVKGIATYFSLYQVYFALYCMHNSYTHYDLHARNVVCYRPAPKKYIHFIYHMKNGDMFDFNTYYLAYIIDYGRNYFYENEENNSSILRETLCRTTCPTNCGNEEGFRFTPKVPNRSMDLRLLNVLEQTNNIDLSEEIVFKEKFRTPELIESGFIEDRINNVSDAFEVIADKVFNLKEKMTTYLISNDYTKLGTLHIYENGNTPAYFEKT